MFCFSKRNHGIALVSSSGGSYSCCLVFFLYIFSLEMVSTALSFTLKVIYWIWSTLSAIHFHTWPRSWEPCLWSHVSKWRVISLTSAVSWSSGHTIGFLKKTRRLKLGNSSASKILTLSNFQLTSIFTLHTRGTVIKTNVQCKSKHRKTKER